MSAAAAVHQLREALERRFPHALPLGHAPTAVVSGTGIGALDALLPGGGLPRGRLTLWQPGGGATAVLRSACEAAVARGERAAWIDGAHLQGGDFWRAGPLLVRPRTPLHALEAAETLLDSGGLSVLILHGCDRDAIREAVRLTRAARTGGSALVLVAQGTAVAHLRAETRVSPDAYRWRTNAFGEPAEPVAVRLEVLASSMGWSGRTSFELPVRTHRLRHFPEPRLPDRRGWRRPRQHRRPA